MLASEPAADDSLRPKVLWFSRPKVSLYIGIIVLANIQRRDSPGSALSLPCRVARFRFQSVFSGSDFQLSFFFVVRLGVMVQGTFVVRLGVIVQGTFAGLGVMRLLAVTSQFGFSEHGTSWK